MSTYTIRLTPAELRNKASEMERQASIVKKEVEKIKSVVDSLKPSFIGVTAAKFFKLFYNALKDMEQWDDLVMTFATETRTAAAKLERADNS